MVQDIEVDGTNEKVQTSVFSKKARENFMSYCEEKRGEKNP